MDGMGSMGSMGTMGMDIVHIPTFGEQLDYPGSRFAHVFTDRERRLCAAKANPAASLAARWAAKEAYLKAWSNSRYGQPPVMHIDEVNFAEIEVVSDAFGRVAIVLRGSIGRIAPPAAFLSISHDGDYAVAVCAVHTPC